MTLRAAYFGVILIWSTTPLTIKWSTQGPGFLFGVTSRMFIGTMLLLSLVWLLRKPLPWHRQARLTYLAAGMGIYGAMMCVYWGAQFIPSGLISVIFGLSPIITGALASLVLREQSFTFYKSFGLLLGLAGLIFIFANGIELISQVGLGIAAVLTAVLLHSVSSVIVKKTHADLPVLSVTTGGMLVALPLYLITWLVFAPSWPAHIEPRALASILYLGIIGSVVGFIMYFYILKHMEASRVALLTLITPVTALWLGYAFNAEIVSIEIIFGTVLILAGMSIYQWGNYFIGLFAKKS